MLLPFLTTVLVPGVTVVVPLLPALLVVLIVAVSVLPSVLLFPFDPLILFVVLAIVDSVVAVVVVIVVVAACLVAASFLYCGPLLLLRVTVCVVARIDVI